MFVMQRFEIPYGNGVMNHVVMRRLEEFTSCKELEAAAFRKLTTLHSRRETPEAAAFKG